MSLAAPLWLWLLPLALWPLLARRSDDALANAALSLMPRDRASDVLQWALRSAAVIAIAALVVALAGPYRPEYPVERVGQGAEIVLVLDRSRSMDQGFAGSRPAGGAVAGTGPEALDYYSKLRANEARESKGKVARQLLSDFAAKRPEDRFGMVVFSTLPMRVLDFTQKGEVIQAAINAGNIGRGLSETNIGLALQAGLGFFDDRPYSGSRILLLVSDGGDHIDADARERIARLARQYRVGIYWIYIRSARSPGLMLDSSEAPANADAAPEYFLHRFFESLGTPYRAYEAENPEALEKAIADVNRLENLPITYLDTVPRRDLSALGYGTALACVLLLFGASLLEIKRVGLSRSNDTDDAARAAPTRGAASAARDGRPAQHAGLHRRLTRAATVLLVAVLLASGFEAMLLWRKLHWNRLIVAEQPAPEAEDQPPELRFAQAAAQAASGALEAALNRYRPLQGDSALGQAARFNSANLLVRQAIEVQASQQPGQAIALLELAKEAYRDVLRHDPQFWDARYNLERAQRLLPDPEDIDSPQTETPRDRERAATTMRAYSPGLP